MCYPPGVLTTLLTDQEKQAGFKFCSRNLRDPDPIPIRSWSRAWDSLWVKEKQEVVKVRRVYSECLIWSRVSVTPRLGLTPGQRGTQWTDFRSVCVNLYRHLLVLSFQFSCHFWPKTSSQNTRRKNWRREKIRNVFDYFSPREIYLLSFL